MTLSVTLAADILVGILLVATILTSTRLSARIRRLKADEDDLRATIGDLVSASAAAERAIAGLRGALAECDRDLAARLDAAERAARELETGVEAGQGVIARLRAIVAGARGATSAADDEPGTDRAEARRGGAPVAVEVRPGPGAGNSAGLQARRPERDAPASNGERLDQALAAAQAMSERVRERLRAQAA